MRDCRCTEAAVLNLDRSHEVSDGLSNSRTQSEEAKKMTTDNEARTFDSLHMGRSSIDLYSNDVGAPFAEIGSFAAYVGGSPTLSLIHI